MEADQDLAVQVAIAQRTRWSIIQLLSRNGGHNGLAAGDIAQALGVSSTNLSMQLSILASAGLVGSERSGRQVRYSLVRGRLAEAGETLRRLANGGVEASELRSSTL